MKDSDKKGKPDYWGWLVVWLVAGPVVMVTQSWFDHVDAKAYVVSWLALGAIGVLVTLVRRGLAARASRDDAAKE